MHNRGGFDIIILIKKRGTVKTMEMMNKICVKAARVYRVLNKPIVRSKVDADFSIYPNQNSDNAVATLKVNNLPEVKLLDLILAIIAIKFIYSAVKTVLGIFR